MRVYYLSSFLLLAACASPQQLCINNAGKEVRILSKLIAVAEGNVTRGYAIETKEYFETGSQICGVLNEEPVYCDVPVVETREVIVAIDLNAEQAKLDSMLRKRTELSSRAAAVIAECKIRHPEV